MSAPPELVRDVVVDLEHYPDWWPQVRAVLKLSDDEAVVLCRAALPYTLELRLTAVSRELPTVRVAIDCDLTGWASWTLEPVLGGTRMIFAQEVDFNRAPAWVVRTARPLFERNHQQMMAAARRAIERRFGVPQGAP